MARLAYAFFVILLSCQSPGDPTAVGSISAAAALPQVESGSALRLGVVLPPKKHRILAPLGDAFARQGLRASLVTVDLSKPSCESEGLHGVQVLLTHCGGLYGEGEGCGWDLDALSRLERLEESGLPVVDRLCGQRIMADRDTVLKCMKQREHVALGASHIQPELRCECGDEWRVRVPVSIAVRGQGQIEEAMKDAGLAFPLIIKPLHDDGRASSHDLAVAWDLAAARECVAESGGVLQEFLEHDGLVYKVYVAGRDVAVVHRPSIANDIGNGKGLVRFSRASSDSVARRMMEEDPLRYEMNVKRAVPLPASVAVQAGALVSQATEASQLFGADIIRRSGTHDCYIVDVNHFPGFHGVAAFPDSLANLLISRARGEAIAVATKATQGCRKGSPACFRNWSNCNEQEVMLATDMWEDNEDDLGLRVKGGGEGGTSLNCVKRKVIDALRGGGGGRMEKGGKGQEMEGRHAYKDFVVGRPREEGDHGPLARPAQPRRKSRPPKSRRFHCLYTNRVNSIQQKRFQDGTLTISEGIAALMSEDGEMITTDKVKGRSFEAGDTQKVASFLVQIEEEILHDRGEGDDLSVDHDDANGDCLRDPGMEGDGDDSQKLSPPKKRRNRHPAVEGKGLEHTSVAEEQCEDVEQEGSESLRNQIAELQSLLAKKDIKRQQKTINNATGAMIESDGGGNDRTISDGDVQVESDDIKEVGIKEHWSPKHHAETAHSTGGKDDDVDMDVVKDYSCEIVAAKTQAEESQKREFQLNLLQQLGLKSSHDRPRASGSPLHEASATDLPTEDGDIDPGHESNQENHGVHKRIGNNREVMKSWDTPNFSGPKEGSKWQSSFVHPRPLDASSITAVSSVADGGELRTHVRAMGDAVQEEFSDALVREGVDDSQAECDIYSDDEGIRRVAGLGAEGRKVYAIVQCFDCDTNQGIIAQSNKERGRFKCKVCGVSQQVDSVLETCVGAEKVRKVVQELNIQRAHKQKLQAAVRASMVHDPDYAEDDEIYHGTDDESSGEGAGLNGRKASSVKLPFPMASGDDSSEDGSVTNDDAERPVREPGAEGQMSCGALVEEVRFAGREERKALLANGVLKGLARAVKIPDEFDSSSEYTRVFTSAIREEINFGLKELAGRFETALIVAEKKAKKEGYHNAIPVTEIEDIAKRGGVQLIADAELLYMGAARPIGGFKAMQMSRMSFKQRKKAKEDLEDEEQTRKERQLTMGKHDKLYVRFPSYSGSIDSGRSKKSTGYSNGQMVKRPSMDKDDLWILCTAKLFNDGSPEDDWASGKRVIVARSQSYGISSAGMISLEVLGPMPVLPRQSNVLAIRGPNISSERLMLDCLNGLSKPPNLYRHILHSKECDIDLTNPAILHQSPEDAVQCNALSLKLRRLYSKLSLLEDSGLNGTSYEQWITNMSNQVCNTFSLDECQRRVVGSVISWLQGHAQTGGGIVLVHGVFGSGKTLTLIATLTLLIQVSKSLTLVCSDDGVAMRIMVCAWTNIAVDRILMGLKDSGESNFLRVGSVRRMARPLLAHNVLSVAMGGDDRMEQDLRSLLKDSEGDVQETALLRNALEDLSSGRTAERAKRLQSYSLVGATITSCTFPVLDKSKFDIVLMDEASQVPEPACLIPVCRFDPLHLMAAGDPQQLPPILRGRQINSDCTPDDLSKTLFERLAKATICDPIMLSNQYRCHETIASLSSRLFYGGVVRSCSTLKDTLPVCDLPVLSMFDTSSEKCRKVAGGWEIVDAQGSVWDEGERKCVAGMVRHLLLDEGLAPSQIGVICMYAAQAVKVKSTLRRMEMSRKGIEMEGQDEEEEGYEDFEEGKIIVQEEGYEGVKVSTVDAFQGEERDVIIVCVTQTKAQQSGHVCNSRRVNVAMTRAKRHLIVMGGEEVLSNVHPWSEVSKEAAKIGGGIADASRLFDYLVG